SLYEVEPDDDGDPQLILHEGHFDMAVDSLSRLKAILMAAESPAQSMNLGTRVAVRIWICNDQEAKDVAVLYNTRGDKVNASTAKSTSQRTPLEKLVRALYDKSPHLGQDNVEVLGDTVSASSHKLCAYNTLHKAVHDFWTGEPVTPREVDEQADFLVRFWDA